MERFINKVSVITGSGSGIGAAIAKEFVKSGLIVVGLDLTENKLKVHMSTINFQLNLSFFQDLYLS